MKRRIFSAALFTLLSGLCVATVHAQQNRINAAVDSSQTVVLPGHIHPQAKAQYDQGAVEGTFQLPSITIHVKPSAAQQQSLTQLLSDQQNPSSPRFHKWLTPDQYADQFGASSSDIAKIRAWLESKGFTILQTARGRNWITFSGTAELVRNGFNAEIHRYNVNGEIHYANATNPAVPAAFANMVSSIRGLNDFRLKPKNLRKAKPRNTADDGSHNVVPDDFAAIYDVTPLYNAHIDGTGQAVVVVGQTQLIRSDISTFRSMFGLGAPNLQEVLVPGQQNPGVQVDSGDLGESDLDVEWSGAVARNATIIFVYSPDIFVSLDYAVDQALAPVISMTYGACEYMDLVDLPGYQSTAQQANSEGITWLAAAGDSGAGDCEDFGVLLAQDGLAVDVPGSIPEVTAVGGTEFNEQGGNYWNANNSSTGASALSYIPEMVWNDTIVDQSISAGGGGASQVFFKPVWQTGPGVPNDGARDVPDVSFNASDAHDPTYVYSDGSDAYYGGTSVGAPTMAGVVALLNHYLVSTGIQSQAGLANINPQIYRLAQHSPGVFHDVKEGNNKVQCIIGTPNCSTGAFGYNAAANYDQASGWGSLDVYNFVHQWNSVAPANSAVVASVSQSTPNNGTGIYGNTSVVFEQPANTWNFTLTLAEEAGLSTTLTGMTINGTDYTAQIASLFGTASIPAGQSISAQQIVLTNLSVPKNVAFTFSGMDANGRKWSEQLSIPFQGAEPILTVAGMSNAASGLQVFAPGEIISVYGGAMGDFAQSAGTLPLTLFLAGFEAYVNDNPAYLFYVSPNQVNLQIPWETEPGPATLTVGNPYADVNFNFQVSQAGPGIFVTPDGFLNPGSSGTRGGTSTLFITGAGGVRPEIPDGLPPQDDSSTPVLGVSLTVGGVTAVTSYVGVPTWSTGVVQINFAIPATVPTGKQPVVVTVGGVPSQTAYVNITQ